MISALFRSTEGSSIWGSSKVLNDGTGKLSLDTVEVNNDRTDRSKVLRVPSHLKCSNCDVIFSLKKRISATVEASSVSSSIWTSLAFSCFLNIAISPNPAERNLKAELSFFFSLS